VLLILLWCLVRLLLSTSIQLCSKNNNTQREREKKGLFPTLGLLYTTLGITFERNRDGKLYPRHGNIMRVIE